MICLICEKSYKPNLKLTASGAICPSCSGSNRDYYQHMFIDLLEDDPQSDLMLLLDHHRVPAVFHEHNKDLIEL